MIKKTILLAGLCCLCLNALALDAGFIAGSVTQPGSFFYGLSFGSGTFVPLVKFEFEGWRIQKSGMNNLSAAVKLRPSLGKFAPYALLGAGTLFERLTFHFGSDYEFYTFIGGGLHVFFTSMFSLRADLRFLHFKDANQTRISGGFFIHL
jgi:hypothetical protein